MGAPGAEHVDATAVNLPAAHVVSALPEYLGWQLTSHDSIWPVPAQCSYDVEVPCGAWRADSEVTALAVQPVWQQAGGQRRGGRRSVRGAGAPQSALRRCSARQPIRTRVPSGVARAQGA